MEKAITCEKEECLLTCESTNHSIALSNYSDVSFSSESALPVSFNIHDTSILSENSDLLIESKKKISIQDFEIIKTIGKGSYAKVVLARNIHNNRLFAIKIIDKKFLEKENKEHEVHIEKYILSKFIHKEDSRNIIKIYSTFQDGLKLYFVLEFCPKGDFSDFIKLNKGNVLNLELIKFYAAEILQALEVLSNKGVIHRDLKPENILIDENFHLKLCDFGTASIMGKTFDREKMKFREIEPNEQLNEEVVGTAEYVSPEVLVDMEVTPAADLWALGIILYQLSHGTTPYKDKTEILIFENILNSDLKLKEVIFK
jgi:3-phosphoinositide dependent protein kinase-1